MQYSHTVHLSVCYCQSCLFPFLSLDTGLVVENKKNICGVSNTLDREEVNGVLEGQFT